MDLRETLTHAPERFGRVAIELGAGWLDALRAGTPPAERERLEGWLAQRRSPHELAELATQGADGRWALVERCRRELGELPRYGYQATTAATFRMALAGGPHLEMPWLWMELFAAIPGPKRGIAEEFLIMASTFDPGALAVVIEHALRTWPAFPHRSSVARRLVGADRVDAGLAMRWLADPALRSLGEDFLRDRVIDHEEELRELLAEAAGGTREAIVRLLREIDARMSLDGRSEPTNDAELQTRLRADPGDATTSLVWIDLLGSAGDPRGEHLALEHAIRDAEPERALELSRAQAEVCRTHRKAIWNRPGGFPFREKYRGRAFVGFASAWDHKVRGKPENILERVQRFANAVTTVAGPSEIWLGKNHGRDCARPAPTEPGGDLEHALAGALGDAAVFEDKVAKLRFVRRDHADVPVADEATLRALCLAHARVTLVYGFQLTWPGTRVLLPHQEGEHYTGGEPLAGRLGIYLEDASMKLGLQLPYETFTRDGFSMMYDAICETLGRVLTPSRFLTFTSSADCKRMVARSARFPR